MPLTSKSNHRHGLHSLGWLSKAGQGRIAAAIEAWAVGNSIGRFILGHETMDQH